MPKLFCEGARKHACGCFLKTPLCLASQSQPCASGSQGARVQRREQAPSGAVARNESDLLRVKKERGHSRSERARFRNGRVGKLACQRIWFGSGNPGLRVPPHASVLSVYIRVIRGKNPCPCYAALRNFLASWIVSAFTGFLAARYFQQANGISSKPFKIP